MKEIKSALEEKRRFLSERATRIRTAGIPALQQLILVGHTDTGGGREARALLTALYAP
ncbi:hypothetical protein [Thiohalobacter sp. COW1]|uniref:hypothetical protein n=1 Tax=Thiohalobacter sp. COW1 TaxID=2795687 RepID=UPI0019166661|nr:hypothetical protein [Thiohalobacter sp. COW1]